MFLTGLQDRDVVQWRDRDVFKFVEGILLIAANRGK